MSGSRITLVSVQTSFLIKQITATNYHANGMCMSCGPIVHLYLRQLDCKYAILPNPKKGKRFSCFYVKFPPWQRVQRKPPGIISMCTTITQQCQKTLPKKLFEKHEVDSICSRELVHIKNFGYFVFCNWANNVSWGSTKIFLQIQWYFIINLMSFLFV